MPPLPEGRSEIEEVEEEEMAAEKASSTAPRECRGVDTGLLVIFWEGGREREREGGREGGREGEREGWREGKREGGRGRN